ncbi:MAG: glycosyltransferase family 39 protein [Firmicutes bacterium]|nr:glycosyltransferase family 39 protein [Bacillota bacterium]
MNTEKQENDKNPGEKENIETGLKTELRYLLVIVLFGCLINMAMLGSMTLWDTDEALYAQIAREMTVSGDYITTQWNGGTWFCHPPLYFWLESLTAKFFGWNEFSARFPSALFGVLLMVLVYYFGKLMVNGRTGFYAALVTGATIQLWVQSRMALLDMPFLFFLIAAVYLFYYGFMKEDKRYYIGFWLCAGLSVVAKGPVGFVLPALYAFFLIMIHRRWNEIPKLIFSWGVPLFLITGVSWYWAMSDIYGRPFMEQVFGYFFFKRIYAPVMNQDGPWYYYIPFFLAGFLPWTAFIPLTFYFLAKKFSDPRSKFLLCWIVFTFLLFTFAGTKRPNYILFIYPALSIALGWALDSIVSNGKFHKASTYSFVGFSVSVILVIAAFIVAAMKLYPAYFNQYAGNLTLLAVPLLIGGIFTLILTFKSKKIAFYGIVAMSAISYLVLLSYVPLVESLKPEPEMSRTIKERMKPGDILALRGNYGRQFSVIYYTGQKALMYHSEDDMVKGINARPGMYIVMHKDEFKRVTSRVTRPFTVLQEKNGIVLFYTGEAIGQNIR